MRTLIAFLVTRAANQKVAAENSARLALHIQSATNGRTSHFYDTTGQKIRGWHKRIPLLVQPQHPLITRYS